ncbi:MAG TPA: Rrf2 family transcriptional regulator [Nocardioides sp.]|uniref:Rrf2 family transcriptional regulator n=1 Tax=Nocardioides sp. TaxID=35761 RepID=UPI002F40F0A3
MPRHRPGSGHLNLSPWWLPKEPAIAANSHLTVAVHALCWLELSSRRGTPTLTSERIAASLDSNPALVRRSLAPLRDAGLLVTGRGPGSGWALGRPASRITLRDVHEAIGVMPAFDLHAHEPNQECPVGFGIRPVLSAVYDDVDRAVADRLDRTTIADLLDTILRDRPLPVG